MQLDSDILQMVDDKKLKSKQQIQSAIDTQTIQIDLEEETTEIVGTSSLKQRLYRLDMHS